MRLTCTCTVRVNVFGDGVVLRSPAKPFYMHGEQVELTAVPAEGETFLGWRGELEGSAHSITLTVDGDKAITATFSGPSLSLTLDTVGTGAVQVEPEQENYPPGAQLTLTATPAPGWQFAGWNGNLAANNPLMLTMHRARHIVATFVQLNYTLSLGPYTNGQVVIMQRKERYQHGDMVTLVAHPDAGYRFVAWQVSEVDSTVDTVITDNPVTITITANLTYTPHFTDILDSTTRIYLPVIAAHR
jgi:hypothetical protein